MATAVVEKPLNSAVKKADFIRMVGIFTNGQISFDNAFISFIVFT